MISDFLFKVSFKIQRILYYFFHPFLWRKELSLNGIPFIAGSSHLTLGKRVSINHRVFLQAGGELIVGDDVTISYGSTILTIGLDTNALQEKKHVTKPVTIGNGVWIASNVTILPGVSIAQGCVIAAGSVVQKSCLVPYSMYAGVPAKYVKPINKEV